MTRSNSQVSYATTQNLSTYSKFFIASSVALVMAGTIISSINGRISDQVPSGTPLYKNYFTSNENSYDSLISPFTGDLAARENDFENEISLFYNKLLTSQKPLGEKFEQVLLSNLWDLYEE